HVVLRRPRVADREPEDVAPVEPRVRDEDLTRRVHARLDLLVLLVGPVAPEHDERKALRRDELPLVRLLDPACEEPPEPDVLAKNRPQRFGAVAAQHRPKLERTEAAA